MNIVDIVDEIEDDPDYVEWLMDEIIFTQCSRDEMAAFARKISFAGTKVASGSSRLYEYAIYERPIFRKDPSEL